MPERCRAVLYSTRVLYRVLYSSHIELTGSRGGVWLLKPPKFSMQTKVTMYAVRLVF